MSNYKNINLRSGQETGCTTKGSQLVTADMDESFIEIVQLLKSMNNPDNFAAYSAGTTYDKDNPELRYVRSNGADGVAKIWEYINATPASGQTPSSSPSYWSEVTIDDIVAELFNDKVNVITVDLTAQQVAELNKTNITVLDAPGVGKVIIPLYAIGYLDAGAVVFHDGNKIDIEIDGVDWMNFSTAFLGSATDYLEYRSSTNGVQCKSNKALLITMDADMPVVSPYYDGTITFKFYYKILSI